MATVKEHYDSLLSGFYTWISGGFEDAKNRNEEFFKKHKIIPVKSGTAIDLGAGSSFQSIPLAEAGYSVTAIDLNGQLLEELRKNVQNLKIVTVQDDLINFQKQCEQSVDLIVCMTDTLLHLDSKETARKLFEKVLDSLKSNGRFVVTFRDLTFELKELDRFISVRRDEKTIFTCFLEYEPDTVKINDIVYKKTDSDWELHKSFFRKIRLGKEWVEKQLSDIGYHIDTSIIENDFVVIIAGKKNL